MEPLLESSLYEPIEFPKSSGNYIIYLTKRDFLRFVSLNVTEIQRELDMEWVERLRTKAHSMFQDCGYYDFGLFHIGQFKSTLYILDGQHRYMVLKDIPEELEIQVKVYNCKTQDGMNNIFQMINGGKPFQSFESISDQILINTFRKHMMTRYKPYLSSARKPRCPNINLDTMIHKMIDIHFIETMGFTNADALIECVEKMNDFYRFASYDSFKKWNIKHAYELKHKCIEKSLKTNKPLLLGMYDHFEWIDLLVRCREEHLDFKKVPHYPLNYRERISKPLRRRVWEKRNGKSLEGKCYCCKEDVGYDAFECGHIQPVFYGGSTTVDNLEPICKICNRDMGTENLEVFVRKNY